MHVAARAPRLTLFLSLLVTALGIPAGEAGRWGLTLVCMGLGLLGGLLLELTSRRAPRW